MVYYFYVYEDLDAIWRESLIMEFNEKLQELRKKNNLTQEELAEKVRQESMS